MKRSPPGSRVGPYDRPLAPIFDQTTFLFRMSTLDLDTLEYTPDALLVTPLSLEHDDPDFQTAPCLHMPFDSWTPSSSPETGEAPAAPDAEVPASPRGSPPEKARMLNTARKRGRPPGSGIKKKNAGRPPLALLRPGMFRARASPQAPPPVLDTDRPDSSNKVGAADDAAALATPTLTILPVLPLPAPAVPEILRPSRPPLPENFAFISAVKIGSVDAVRQLARSPAINVNQADEAGVGALMYAVVGGRDSLVHALLDIAHLDVNVVGLRGLTPLHYLLNLGRADLAYRLVCHPTFRSTTAFLPDEKRGWAPVHYACQPQNSQLLCFMASRAWFMPNFPTRTGDTPLSMACMWDCAAAAQIILQHHQFKPWQHVSALRRQAERSAHVTPLMRQVVACVRRQLGFQDAEPEQ